MIKVPWYYAQFDSLRATTCQSLQDSLFESSRGTIEARWNEVSIRGGSGRRGHPLATIWQRFVNEHGTKPDAVTGRTFALEFHSALRCPPGLDILLLKEAEQLVKSMHSAPSFAPHLISVLLLLDIVASDLKEKISEQLLEDILSKRAVGFQPDVKDEIWRAMKDVVQFDEDMYAPIKSGGLDVYLLELDTKAKFRPFVRLFSPKQNELSNSSRTTKSIPSRTPQEISGETPEAPPQKSTCPYCLKPLPEELTPRLAKVFEAIKDQRKPNSHSIREWCYLHDREADKLPGLKVLAAQKGWPEQVNFKSIRGRVEAMRSHLEAILYGTAKLDGESNRGAIWDRIADDIKVHGTRKTFGISGLMRNNTMKAG